MAGLLDLVQQELSGNGLQQLSNHIGADPETTRTGIAAALPALVGGMAQTAQQPGGEQAIHEAAQQHEGLLGNLGALLGRGQGSTPAGAGAPPGGSIQPATGTPADLPTDGGGLLNRLFGGQQQTVQNHVSQSSGLAPDQTRKLLMVLAPLALAALAHQRRQGQVGPGGLSGFLQQSAAQQSGVGGMLGNLFGR
jgi:hypothetical protein